MVVVVVMGVGGLDGREDQGARRRGGGGEGGGAHTCIHTYTSNPTPHIPHRITTITAPARYRQRLSEQEGGAASLVAEKNEFRAKCDDLAQQLAAAKRWVCICYICNMYVI